MFKNIRMDDGRMDGSIYYKLIYESLAQVS